MNDILARFSADPLATLAAALYPDPPDAIGQDDYALYPGHSSQSEAIAAAVLLPIVARGAGPSILFTRRTERLARHSGQVSFPGGRCDAGDASPLATALRETWEETGIAPGFVRLAGYLPRTRTGTGFDIWPVVGLVREGFALAPQPDEVAEIFEAPLAFFLDPANRGQEERVLGGHTRRFDVFRPGGHYIWGATAAILADFARRLTAAENAITPP